MTNAQVERREAGGECARQSEKEQEREATANREGGGIMKIWRCVRVCLYTNVPIY